VQLTDDELRRLFTAQFDHDTFRLQCIFQLALVSMLRADNLMGARKEWWNLSKRWRHIPAEFMKGKGGEKRDLSVPISEREAEIVAVAMRRSPPSNPYLFPNMNGRPSKWPRKTVRNVCTENGIRYFGAHDLARYTGMAVLEERGVSKVVIKRYVGHAYISQRRDVTDDYVARSARLRSEDRLRQLCAVLDTFRQEIGASEIPTTNRQRGPRVHSGNIAEDAPPRERSKSVA
jgi:integrase